MGVLRAMRARPADVAAELDDPIGDLLRRAGRGDQSAFADLYDALSPLVYGVVLKVVRDPSQAEEVAQEVFVELWRLAARFDGTKGSAKTWAATLRPSASTECAASRPHVRQDRGQPDRAPGGDVGGRSRVIAERVRATPCCSCPSCSAAVELAYFGGHAYREVVLLNVEAPSRVESIDDPTTR